MIGQELAFVKNCECVLMCEYNTTRRVGFTLSSSSVHVSVAISSCIPLCFREHQMAQAREQQKYQTGNKSNAVLKLINKRHPKGYQQV